MPFLQLSLLSLLLLLLLPPFSSAGDVRIDRLAGHVWGRGGDGGDGAAAAAAAEALADKGGKEKSAHFKFYAFFIGKREFSVPGAAARRRPRRGTLSRTSRRGSPARTSRTSTVVAWWSYVGHSLSVIPFQVPRMLQAQGQPDTKRVPTES